MHTDDPVLDLTDRFTAALNSHGLDAVLALALLEFDTDRVVAALINVLDRARALGFHPAHTHGGRDSGVLGGLKLARPT